MYVLEKQSSTKGKNFSVFYNNTVAATVARRILHDVTNERVYKKRCF